MREALAQAATAENLNSYERTPILPALREAVAPDWPYQPAAFLATNGGYNAVYAVLHATVLPGACVAIEDPTAMRLLDIIEDLGAEILPVARDAEGPSPPSSPPRWSGGPRPSSSSRAPIPSPARMSAPHGWPNSAACSPAATRW